MRNVTLPTDLHHKSSARSRWARRNGIGLSAYLDDLLIIAKNKQTFARRTDMVIRRLIQAKFLGQPTQIIPSTDKSDSTLGFHDSHRQHVSYHSETEGSRLASRSFPTTASTLLLHSQSSSAQRQGTGDDSRRLSNPAATAVPTSHKEPSPERLGSWTAITPLPQEAQEELTWWITQLRQWNGHSFLPSTPHAGSTPTLLRQAGGSYMHQILGAASGLCPNYHNTSTARS